VLVRMVLATESVVRYPFIHFPIYPFYPWNLQLGIFAYVHFILDPTRLGTSQRG